MVLYCLLDKINGSTVSLDNARDFMFQKNLLKNSMSCPGCNTAMSMVSCSSSKSPDGLIWHCSPCKKCTTIRPDSALSGQKIAFKTFIQLLFCLSIKGLTGISISQFPDYQRTLCLTGRYTSTLEWRYCNIPVPGLSENTLSDWKIYFHTRVEVLRYPR